MREIALDTETTGLDPQSGHRIVEIGCVEMVNCVRTGQHFHVYLNPERPMPEEAFRVHGLSDDFLSDKPRFADTADALLDFLAGDRLVIHNATFDIGFLNHELQRLGKPLIDMPRALDTVHMARRKFPGSPVGLDALCRRFEIDLTGRTLHGALLDAELLAEVYLELCGGRQAALALAPETAREKDGATMSVMSAAARRPLRTARYFNASAEEKRLHTDFLATLGVPAWENAE